MTRNTPKTWRRVAAAVVAVALAGAVGTAPAGASPGEARDRGGLYVPPPDHGAKRQIAQLTAQGDRDQARLVRAMIETPQAVWFTAGSPVSGRRGTSTTGGLA